MWSLVRKAFKFLVNAVLVIAGATPAAASLNPPFEVPSPTRVKHSPGADPQTLVAVWGRHNEEKHPVALVTLIDHGEDAALKFPSSLSNSAFLSRTCWSIVRRWLWCW